MQMTSSDKHNPVSILIAIDIAKKSHDILIALLNGRHKIMKIPNSINGYQQLIAAANTDSNNITVSFEPTADWLHAQGVKCCLISSLAYARAREMLYKSWDKHHRKKDARVILYLMQNNIMQPFHDPLVTNYMDIQELSNTYHQISLART